MEAQEQQTTVNVTLGVRDKEKENPNASTPGIIPRFEHVRSRRA